MASIANGRIATVLDAIEEALFEPAALCAAERDMRDGRCVLALIDGIEERKGVALTRRCEIMAKVIATTGKY